MKKIHIISLIGTGVIMLIFGFSVVKSIDKPDEQPIDKTEEVFSGELLEGQTIEELGQGKEYLSQRVIDKNYIYKLTNGKYQLSYIQDGENLTEIGMNGQAIKFTDKNGNVYEYIYDTLGNLICYKENYKGKIEIYYYDYDGQGITENEFNELYEKISDTYYERTGEKEIPAIRFDDSVEKLLD